MAEVTVNVIKTIFTGEVTPLKDATKKAEDALKGFNKAASKSASFAGKIGKILEYRFIRGGISKIMQGLEEGKKAIEAYDKALNGLSASKAAFYMKEMKENAVLLQNTFASLFMTVYASLSPAINKIVELIQDAMNAVNQFISALMGRNTYTKAVKGINNVTDSVKALKKQIFGFDELNILNAPGGASGEDFSKNFEEAEVSSFFTNLANAVDWEMIIKSAKIVGGILATWAVNKELLSFFDKLTVNKFALGVTLSVVGIVGLVDALQDAVKNGVTEDTVMQALLSSGALILGGITVGQQLGNAMIGGIVAGLVAGTFMIATGVDDALTNGLSKADAKLITLGTMIITTAIGALFGPLGAGVGALVGLALGGFITFATNARNHEQGISTEFDHWLSSLRISLADTYFRIYDKLPTWLKSILDAFGIFRKDLDRTQLTPLANRILDIIDLFRQLKELFHNTSFAGEAAELKVKGFANGGYPSTGDLFIANESGPELVGSFGNRTGVYNQEQFAAAMAYSNQAVVQAVYAIGSQITNAVDNKPVPNVRIGDRDIYQSSQRGAKLAGSSLIQGGRA